MRGVRTDGPMAQEIALDRQRPAQYVFSAIVQHKLPELRTGKSRAKEPAAP